MRGAACPRRLSTCMAAPRWSSRERSWCRISSAATATRSAGTAAGAVPRHLCAFLTGLVAVGVALVSPLDSLGESLLLAHMGQHLLLMLVAPPLLWLGAPVAPLLLGLPRRLRRAVATGLALAPVRKLAESVRHPIVAWVSFSLAFWVWHVPALYDLALHSA